jgi:hypothetical protein
MGRITAKGDVMNEDNELNHPSAVCHMHGLPCHELGEVLIERDALRSRLAALDAAKAGEPPMPRVAVKADGCYGLEELKIYARQGWDAAAALRVEVDERRAKLAEAEDAFRAVTVPPAAPQGEVQP